MARLERDSEVRKGLYTRQPVYYCKGADGAWFYSDTIHGLLEESGHAKEFNRDIVPTYLRFWYPATENTFYKGVKRLLPGFRLVENNGNVTVDRFEDVEFTSNRYESYESAVEDLKGILSDIFETERKTSDASFLSSGVDSSLLAAGLPAKQVVSVGYEESRYDESKEAAAIAEALNVDFHVCPVTIEEYFEVVPEAMVAREEPSGDSSYIPLFLAAREAAKHTSACCSGEGPDELFCGYKVYQNYLNSPQVDYWKAAHTCMKTRGLKEPERYLERFSDGFEKMQAFDLTYATECNLLPNLDAVARANKVDIRTPLIDRRLFDFAVSIPTEYKVTTDNNKIVFRDAAESFLPQEVAQKPKRAFPVPTQVWMHEEPWASMLKELFSSREAKYLLSGLLPRYYIKKYFSEAAGREATSSYWHPVWTMYALLVWYRGEFGTL